MKKTNFVRSIATAVVALSLVACTNDEMGYGYGDSTITTMGYYPYNPYYPTTDYRYNYPPQYYRATVYTYPTYYPARYYNNNNTYRERNYNYGKGYSSRYNNYQYYQPDGTRTNSYKTYQTEKGYIGD